MFELLQETLKLQEVSRFTKKFWIPIHFVFIAYDDRLCFRGKEQKKCWRLQVTPSFRGYQFQETAFQTF